MAEANSLDGITIDKRFRGPPRSGNGGYVSGKLAACTSWPVTSVTLKSPPPLNKELSVKRNGDAAVLCDGDLLVASAEPAVLPPTTLGAVSVEDARAASRGYVGHSDHLCPGCFVCGPEREMGDGLRIFAGPVEGEDVVAAAWEPAMDLCDGDGFVRQEFLWAALDCPTYFALPVVGDLALLGSMTVEMFSRPAPGQDLVIVAKPISADGRKHLSASALYSSDGQLLAAAACLWIMLKEDQFGIYDVEGKAS